MRDLIIQKESNLSGEKFKETKKEKKKKKKKTQTKSNKSLK